MRRRDWDCKVEYIHFERNGLQVRLDETASQHFGVCNSMKAEGGRLQQHPGRSAASPLQLKQLLSSSVLLLVDGLLAWQRTRLLLIVS